MNIPKPHDIKIVFRTGKIHEYDLVLNELKSAEIPTFTQQQTSAGLRLATPVTLTGDAGNWWAIGVPTSSYEDAISIIESLPIPRKDNPEVWDFADNTARRYLRRFYQLNVIMIILLFLYLAVIEIMKLM